MNFNEYATYYNSFYKDKSYQNEIRYIDNIIKEHSNGLPETLLDIGCGTGEHDALLSKLGYEVTGIDLSEDMIKIAKSNYQGIDFYSMNSCEMNLDKQFDIVTSLFHVISYLNSNEQLSLTFSNIEKHLNPSGLFVFDCWYGPCVLNEKPELRVKKVENNEVEIIRIANPELLVNKNIVNVNYEFHVFDKVKKDKYTFHETHSMRYFFKPEIEKLAVENGFSLLSGEEWVSGDSLSENSWGACFILRKEN